MSVNYTHKALIRENLQRSPHSTQPRKKRKKMAVSRAPDPGEPITIDARSTDDFDGVDLEDVDLDLVATAPSGRDSMESPSAEKPENPQNSPEISGPLSDNETLASEFDSDDFEDLEDVDFGVFDDVPLCKKDSIDETLTFAIDTAKDDVSGPKKKRAFVPILKHERKARKLVHKTMLFTMICHGAVRNRWCSDPKILRLIKRIVSQEIVSLFDQDQADVLDYVKAKRFVDGLRKLMAVFSRRFKVMCPGIQRRDWGYKEITSEDLKRKVTFEKFTKAVKMLVGSRDIGAQSFVALLRSLGINARLVFSVQVPDFRSLRSVKHDNGKKPDSKSSKNELSTPKSEFDPVFIPNSRQSMLSGIRLRKKKTEKTEPETSGKASGFPVFWIEVWNKYSKKWITIDPIVFKVVEVMPMRRKGKFEAPASDETHQTWYVIAYDRYGCVKDVTRRYTQYYNAKTSKRRIGNLSEKDEHWYDRAICAVNRRKACITKAEATELKEFYDRHICEGMPNNMADFKNHPVYALELQLRQDEVVHPNDETSKCGTFRSSNRNKIVPVYKRSCVYQLKTPKAWHMCGRVLKLGAQPLKTKTQQVQFIDENPGNDDAENNGEIRLYAEFQTDLYRPPPITDRKIVKNAYGNVEIFRPSMVPENGYLVPLSQDISMKMLETAARWILNIDYAKAIVSFEFGKGQKTKRAPTAKEGGILIDVQYKEGIVAVLEGLVEQQEQDKREAVELSALRSWNFFLKKLQIIKRLDRNHGKLANGDDDWLEPGNPSKNREKRAVDDEEDDGYYSVGSEDDVSCDNGDSDGEDEEGGGFMLEDTAFRIEEEDDGLNAGGFLQGATSMEIEGGGFSIEPENEDQEERSGTDF